MILDASIFAYLGTILAAIAIVVVTRRLGTLTLRRVARARSDPRRRRVGRLRPPRLGRLELPLVPRRLAARRPTDTGVQTGQQRTMLLWMGWQMWKDHPLLGLGLDRSNTDFEPYLAALKRRFPNQPAQAYPSNANPWGVQNYYVELAADTGIVGFLLGLAVFGDRAPARCPAGVAGARSPASSRSAGSSWPRGRGTRSGSSPGIPLDALTWIGLGLAAAAIPIAAAAEPAGTGGGAGRLGLLVRRINRKPCRSAGGPIPAPSLERLAGWTFPVVFVLAVRPGGVRAGRHVGHRDRQPRRSRDPRASRSPRSSGSGARASRRCARRSGSGWHRSRCSSTSPLASALPDVLRPGLRLEDALRDRGQVRRVLRPRPRRRRAAPRPPGRSGASTPWSSCSRLSPRAPRSCSSSACTCSETGAPGPRAVVHRHLRPRDARRRRARARLPRRALAGQRLAAGRPSAALVGGALARRALGRGRGGARRRSGDDRVACCSSAHGGSSSCAASLSWSASPPPARSG